MKRLTSWYPQLPGQRVRQIIIDLSVLVWVIACATFGLAAHGTIAALATPLRSTREQARQLAEQADQAAQQSSHIPGVGGDLRKPFDGASDSLQAVMTAVDQQIALIEHAAVLLGCMIFIIPVVALLLIWVPTRLRFRRRALAAQQLLDGPSELKLFALRALATRPLSEIAKIGDDPLTGWSRGDQHIIRALAEIELRSSGLRPPPDQGSTGDRQTRAESAYLER